jgi:hypothetical protein
VTSRVYRVKVYNDGGRVLHSKNYMITVDLDTPAGLKLAARELDEMVVAAADLDRAPADMVRHYYLTLHDPVTGDPVL